MMTNNYLFATPLFSFPSSKRHCTPSHSIVVLRNVSPSPRVTHSFPNSFTLNLRPLHSPTRFDFPGTPQYHRPSPPATHKSHRPLLCRMRSRIRPTATGPQPLQLPPHSPQNLHDAVPAREGYTSDAGVEMGTNGTIRLRIGLLLTSGIRGPSGETSEKGRVRTGHLRVDHRAVRV